MTLHVNEIIYIDDKPHMVLYLKHNLVGVQKLDSQTLAPIPYIIGSYDLQSLEYTRHPRFWKCPHQNRWDAKFHTDAMHRALKTLSTVVGDATKELGAAGQNFAKLKQEHDKGQLAAEKQFRHLDHKQEDLIYLEIQARGFLHEQVTKALRYRRTKTKTNVTGFDPIMREFIHERIAKNCRVAIFRHTGEHFYLDLVDTLQRIQRYTSRVIVTSGEQDFNQPEFLEVLEAELRAGVPKHEPTVLVIREYLTADGVQAVKTLLGHLSHFSRRYNRKFVVMTLSGQFEQFRVNADILTCAKFITVTREYCYAQ
ncbi:MAG: hypothetical protein [Bacteriophage sp.]|nr:MAG: hypothetical protein [Bacteriophage sp.]